MYKRGYTEAAIDQGVSKQYLQRLEAQRMATSETGWMQVEEGNTFPQIRINEQVKLVRHPNWPRNWPSVVVFMWQHKQPPGELGQKLFNEDPLLYNSIQWRVWLSNRMIVEGSVLTYSQVDNEVSRVVGRMYHA